MHPKILVCDSTIIYQAPERPSSH